MTMCRAVCLLVALGVAAGAVPAAAQGQATEAAVPRMTLADFKKGLEAGTILALDIRDAAVFAKGHIPGAASLPPADVIRRAAEFKAEKRTIVTYCA